MGRPRNARYGLPPDVHVVRAKGREYFYFQKNRCEKDEGPRVKLAGQPYDDDGTPDAEWWQSYRDLAGIDGEEKKAAGTFAALIAEYKLSPEWTALSKRTIVEWTRHLAYVEEKWGNLRVTRDRAPACAGAAGQLRRHPAAGCHEAHQAAGGLREPPGGREQSPARALLDDDLVGAARLDRRQSLHRREKAERRQALRALELGSDLSVRAGGAQPRCGTARRSRSTPGSATAT